MKHSLAALLVTAIACVPITAIAQDKPAFAPRTFEAAKQKSRKTTNLSTALNQRIDDAFKGEEKLRAAMNAELKAIRAEKNSQVRKAMAAAYKAKYEKDVQRVLSKSNLIQDFAAQMRAANPGMTFTTTATQVTSQVMAAQSQPSPPRPPASLDTVKDLQGSDYQFINDSNCSPGRGESTRSGGVMTSESEGCLTTGLMVHEFDVPADKKGRIELTANLLSESHTINSYSGSLAGIRLTRRGNNFAVDDIFVLTHVSQAFVGEDAKQEFTGASIIRDLEPGHYRIEAYTESDASSASLAYAAAEAKVQALRVKLITSPR